MLLAPVNNQAHIDSVGPQKKSKNRWWSTVDTSDRRDLKSVIGEETFRESQLNNVLAELHAKGYPNAQAQVTHDLPSHN